MTKYSLSLYLMRGFHSKKQAGMEEIRGSGWTLLKGDRFGDAVQGVDEEEAVAQRAAQAG